MPEIKQQRWKIVEYSKRQIDDAGNIIRKDNTTAEELAFATQVIDNWRAAHAYPMHVIYTCGGWLRLATISLLSSV